MELQVYLAFRDVLLASSGDYGLVRSHTISRVALFSRAC